MINVEKVVLLALLFSLFLSRLLRKLALLKTAKLHSLSTVLLPQVQTPKDNVNENLVYKGLWLIICGLIKKALIADYIAQYNNIVFDAPASQSGFGNLMGDEGFLYQSADDQP